MSLSYLSKSSAPFEFHSKIFFLKGIHGHRLSKKERIRRNLLLPKIALLSLA